MTITELVKQAFENAKEKGWHDEERSPLEYHALIHSEISEATEEARKGSPSVYQIQKDYEEVKVASGLSFFISKCDVEHVMRHKWYVGSGQYVRRTTDDMSLHRYILSPEDNELVDHENLNPLDNRRDNLRVCTKQQNQQNQGSSKNKRFKGIYYHKQNKNWCARITHNYKCKTIGSFKTEIKAAKAYDEAAKKYFGDFAYLNFPEINFKEDVLGNVVEPNNDSWDKSIKPEGELIELADAVIRIFDYAGAKGWDLEEAIKLKMTYNKTRSHRHGGKKY